MKKIDVKKLKYNYRKIVDKRMNEFLKDERTSYLNFIKIFPLIVIMCSLVLIFYEMVKIGPTVTLSDISFFIWFFVIMAGVCAVYPLFLIGKFPRKYHIIYGEVESKRIESDEVTNAYFIKVKGYGKEFTSLSTVYNDIEENKINIFVVSECDNRICMVLDKLLDTETYNSIISV